MLRTAVLTFAALLSAIFLSRRLKPLWEGQEMVGILLPPSVPGALVNYAAVLAGKTPFPHHCEATNWLIVRSLVFGSHSRCESMITPGPE